MKTIINGHKIETRDVNSALSIVEIDGGNDNGGAEVRQILHSHGQSTMAATAWDAKQRDLIAETFPNLPYQEGASNGFTVWNFRLETNV